MYSSSAKATEGQASGGVKDGEEKKEPARNASQSDAGGEKVEEGEVVE